MATINAFVEVDRNPVMATQEDTVTGIHTLKTVAGTAGGQASSIEWGRNAKLETSYDTVAKAHTLKVL